MPAHAEIAARARKRMAARRDLYHDRLADLLHDEIAQAPAPQAGSVSQFLERLNAEGDATG